MRPTLSVIIPVYNSEKYIAECIQSVLSQTFTDFEIILVDDGSTDASGAICDEYRQRFPEKIKVIHKPNGGAASARNAGIDIAAGRFLAFTDSDDTIHPDMYTTLFETIERTGADIVETFFIPSGNKIEALKHWNAETALTGRDALCQMLDWNMTASLCTKLFRKEAVKGLRMDEGHTNEDFRYLCEVYLREPSVVVLPQAFYTYRATEGSVTRSLRPNFFDIFRNLDYVATLLPHDDKGLRKQFRVYSLTMHIMSGVRIVRGRHNNKYKKWLRQNRSYILRSWKTLLFGRHLSLRWRAKALYTFLHLP